jgi:hypothetical protein
MTFLIFAAAIAVAQTTPSPKVDIVSVTGCLKEATRHVDQVNATDPVPSNANAPSPKEVPAAPPVGKTNSG